jgi:DNA invertase Pin-like site-specific DNA recombinase
MLLGYARVSKGDGSQKLDLQVDALREAGVTERDIYDDMASGARADRPGLENCLRALREGDTLVVWKLDRLGRSTRHLIELVNDLKDRDVHLRVLTGELAGTDTSTPMGGFIFTVFAGLAEMERGFISERTKAGLRAAKRRGKTGGRPPALSGAKRKAAIAAMAEPDVNVTALAEELGVSTATLYRLPKKTT